MSAQMTADQLNELSITELETHLDEARDSQPRTYLKSVMIVRNRKIAEEQADAWGLSVEQYAKAKKLAQDQNIPLIKSLNEARRASYKKAKSVQSATAQPVNLGANASNV